MIAPSLLIEFSFIAPLWGLEWSHDPAGGDFWILNNFISFLVESFSDVFSIIKWSPQDTRHNLSIKGFLLLFDIIGFDLLFVSWRIAILRFSLW